LDAVLAAIGAGQRHAASPGPGALVDHGLARREDDRRVEVPVVGIATRRDDGRWRATRGLGSSCALLDPACAGS
jgi:hypothetical protein